MDAWILFLLAGEVAILVCVLPFTWIRPSEEARRRTTTSGELLREAHFQQTTSDSANARKCLKLIEARRQSLRTLGEELCKLFGFQEPSIANQLEHLESLLVWSITQSLISLEGAMISAAEQEDVIFSTAVQALHNKISSNR